MKNYLTVIYDQLEDDRNWFFEGEGKKKKKPTQLVANVKQLKAFNI